MTHSTGVPCTGRRCHGVCRRSNGHSARRHQVWRYEAYPFGPLSPFSSLIPHSWCQKATGGSVIDFGLVLFGNWRCGCSSIGRKMHVRLSCTRALWAIAARLNLIWPMPFAFLFPFTSHATLLRRRATRDLTVICWTKQSFRDYVSALSKHCERSVVAR